MAEPPIDHKLLPFPEAKPPAPARKPPRWLSWEEVCGELTCWGAVRQRWDVDAILFSPARQTLGYRINRIGILPAMLVLPQAWHARLPEEAPDAP
jgi:hypothetical protein